MPHHAHTSLSHDLFDAPKHQLRIGQFGATPSSWCWTHDSLPLLSIWEPGGGTDHGTIAAGAAAAGAAAAGAAAPCNAGKCATCCAAGAI